MKQESVQFHTVILSCWKKTLLLVCEWKRATVQVPTGLHSQTVMTGWSNYWAVDTPAWREFISSRKGDSQITVYPHPAPSSGLILLMRSHHRQTPSHCWHSRACNRPHAFKALLRRSHGHSLHPSFYSTREHMCCHTPWTSPRFPSNTPSQIIKAHRMTTLGRCVWERQRNGENRRNRWHQPRV